MKSKVNIDTVNCGQKHNVPIGGFYFLTATADGQPNYFRCPFDSAASGNQADCADSWFLASYAPAAYRTCRVTERRNRTSCHQLANMCVLNLYSYPMGKASSYLLGYAKYFLFHIACRLKGALLDRIDACRAYDQVYQMDKGEDLPWLRYPEVYGDFKSKYLQNGIDSEYLKVIESNNSTKMRSNIKFSTNEYR